MQKQTLGALLKGLPFWLYLAVALILAGLIFWLYKSIDTASMEISLAAANLEAGLPQGTLTADEQTAATLIQNFELRAHTINAYKNATLRAQVYTGPFLDTVDQYYDGLDGTNDWIIFSQAEISRVKLISKTDSKIIALACVNASELELDQKGKLVKQLPVSTFAGAFVFVSDAGTWKLANFIDVSNAASARETYANSAADLQELTGSLNPLLAIKCK
jgi:hypothetical protein